MSGGKPIKVPRRIWFLGREFRLFTVTADMIPDQRRALASKVREFGLHDLITDSWSHPFDQLNLIYERVSAMDAFPQLIARGIVEVGSTWNEWDAKVLEAELRGVDPESEPNMEPIRRHVVGMVACCGVGRTPFEALGSLGQLPPGMEYEDEEEGEGPP